MWPYSAVLPFDVGCRQVNVIYAQPRAYSNPSKPKTANMQTNGAGLTGRWLQSLCKLDIRWYMNQ